MDLEFLIQTTTKGDYERGDVITFKTSGENWGAFEGPDGGYCRIIITDVTEQDLVLLTEAKREENQQTGELEITARRARAFNELDVVAAIAGTRGRIQIQRANLRTLRIK